MIAAAMVGLSFAPRRAGAADYEVKGDTAFQAYQVTDPWGETALDRRRLMQTLQLGAYNLQGAYRPGEADYAVVLRLRLDADFGINDHLQGAQAGGETTYTTGAGLGARYVPGLQTSTLSLMYGYVEGRNLAHGVLGFRVGRQYLTDALGWWSFDGGLVRVTTPFYVQAEVYAGLEQRGGLPLSSSQFERQGVWRGSHSGYGSAGQPGLTDYPSYQFSEPAPAFGFALESAGVSFLHSRFSYRRVYNTGASITQQFPDATGGYRETSGARISQDRLGYAGDVNLKTVGALKGGFTYDLYDQLVASYFGGVEVNAGQRVTLGVDADYFVPTFDADSIWNWFTHGPITSFTGRAAVKATRRLDFAASGGARLWTTDGDPTTFASGECKQAQGTTDCLGKVSFDPSPGGSTAFSRQDQNRPVVTTTDALANLTGRYRWPSASVGLKGMLEAGSRGRRAGADLTGDKRLQGGTYTVGSRLSLYDWADPLRPDRDATSFAYVLAAGYRPTPVADLRLEWEHDMNRLVGQRFRVLGLVNLWVLR